MEDGVWALHGGLVNNLPLGDARERIFAQPSDGEVRRAVLYVSPTSAANRPGAPLL